MRIQFTSHFFFPKNKKTHQMTGSEKVMMRLFVSPTVALANMIQNLQIWMDREGLQAKNG
ncbi:MAG: hypothetical protein UT30_C0011G0053 [Candidatus Uhrbacteria bacterium GW2011_GWF2_39_13]|uniref:Uncharacterized protein n=1 Tax=Candidatus Uhrbacteria bacterium GW2011_GWF2_39_13 TaxID=1618995 RepID=A0A0G0QRG9_9BACT|nr:MAG: hypothetical protein UT30_C0011G0053 [Candidatus Uhrbacteria bacterium GW2011_GWF2_39_13]HAU66620.1 hypothetical protein [Candidatus Uhrbacteria bacterium]